MFFQSFSLLCNILIYDLFISLLNKALLPQFKVFYTMVVQKLFWPGERRLGNFAICLLAFFQVIYMSPCFRGGWEATSICVFLLSDWFSASILEARMSLNGRGGFFKSQSPPPEPWMSIARMNAFAFKGDFHFSSVFIFPWK